MAASKTLTPEQRKTRASKAIAVRHERERLIKAYADKLAGEPLAAKTVDELRELLAGASR